MRYAEFPKIILDMATIISQYLTGYFTDTFTDAFTDTFTDLKIR